MASFDGHSFCARCRDKKKGTDTCLEILTADCKFCLLLTPEQKAQLATPSYKLKKEKRDAKKAELFSPSKDSTLVDPSTVSVIAPVTDTPLVTPSYKLKKEKRDAKKAELFSPSKDSTLVDPSTVSVIAPVTDTPLVSSPPDKKLKDKPSTSKSKKSVDKSTDKKMEELDQKWLDRFNRLEALLLSKSFPPTSLLL